MLIRYIDQSIGADRRLIVETANGIVARATRQNIVLTLRAIYYQFVSRFPFILDPTHQDEGRSPNTQQNYKRLGETLNVGRLVGLMSWEAMEDITRNVIEQPNWPGPLDFLDDAARWFAADLWENQPIRPYLWIEKDAQLGTFQALCRRMRVPLFSCRGNVSQSEMWKAGQSFREVFDKGQTPVVLYAGDHDPNGLDMTRDVHDRLALFAEEEVEVRRILLNMDQIQDFAPPPNPVKLTDSRAGKLLPDGTYTPGSYREKMRLAGHDPDECFEMDAMDAAEMVRIATEAIDELRDPDLWNEALEREGRLRGAVRDVIDRGRPGYNPADYGEEP